MKKILAALFFSMAPFSGAVAAEQTLTPKQVMINMLELMRSGQTLKNMETYYADDFVIDTPFSLPEPERLEGKDHIIGLVKQAEAARGGKLAPIYRDIEVRDLKIYETTDPEVVIMEWVYRSHYDGKVLDTANIVVTRIRDGKIVSTRDYHDSVRRAIGFGNGDKLIAKIQEMIKTSAPQGK
jgi:ketosteroid isomerase-like protein